MKAKFEKYTLSDTVHTTAIKYKNLHNLPHWHTEYELVFVLEGAADIMINNNFFKISEGSCAFISSEEIHYIKATPESILGIIKTDASYIKRIASNYQLTSPILKNSGYAKQNFYDIFSELKNQKDFHNIIADSITTKFVAEIFRNEEITPRTETAKKTTKKYKDLIEMLSNNYTHITFDKAAEYMNLNKSYFSRYFYKFSGLTFTEYLNILKVSAAIEKIRENELNITDISITCGFGTIRNFNRVFKALTGYSPKELPIDYVFAYTYKDTHTNDFNPTLNCTEYIE
ncbi:MAG: helix-turn-helix transcriptional regulator [Clostridia bacterium]|nr:helix-turn-helix transcriptional regulator [Clostridia bacterium]